jgi:acetyl-CoA carboxylase beta subunit
MMWMEMAAFIAGIISTTMLFALLKDNAEEWEEVEEGPREQQEVEIHDFTGRHVTLSCQTCRKLKRHKEVETNLFQCVKCKRHVDLRAS